MKKIALMCLCAVLSACEIRAGNHEFWPARDEWVESFQTLPITFYDNSYHVVKSELLTERNFPVNKVLSATLGYSIVDDKTYRKVYYAKEVLRPNMDGGLVSGGYPVSYKKDKIVEMFGEVLINDEERYALIPTGDEEFYALVDGEGYLYPRIGQIRHDRLALTASKFVTYPEDFAFEPVVLTKTEQTSPVKGFDIKYGGLKAGYVSFIYYRFDVPSNDGLHDSGEFEVLSYPNKPGLINIRGVKIKILEAKEDSIDYMIIEK